MSNAAKRIEDLEREKSTLVNKVDNKSLAEQSQQLNVRKIAQENQSVADIQVGQMERMVESYKQENEGIE